MTTLRDQFPISPRKFWKKIFERSDPLTRRGGFSGLFISWFISLFHYYNVFKSHPDNSFATHFQWVIVKAGLVLLLLVVVWHTIKAIYVFYYIRNYYYDADSSFITIREGVFKPNETRVHFQNVQVRIEQDLRDTILGIYDVHLMSPTSIGYSVSLAHIDGLDKNVADGLKEYILSRA